MQSSESEGLLNGLHLHLSDSQLGPWDTEGQPSACGDASSQLQQDTQTTILNPQVKQRSQTLAAPVREDQQLREGVGLLYPKGQLVACQGRLELVVLPEGVAPDLTADTALPNTITTLPNNTTNHQSTPPLNIITTLPNTNHQPTPPTPTTEGSSGGPDSASRHQYKRLTVEDMRPYFHLNLKDAAVELDVCATTLKRTCRRLGIRNWPRKALADAEAERLSASALAHGPSRPLRRTPRTITSRPGTSARSDGSYSPKMSSNPGAGGRTPKRFSTRNRNPVSSRDSGTSAPDVTAEDSSSVGGGQGESAVVWLQQVGGSSRVPPYWQHSNTAPRLHAPPRGRSSKNQSVKSSHHAVNVHAFPPRQNTSMRPMSSSQGGWPVNAGGYMGPMTFHHPLALGVGQRPTATAATAGSYGMPNAGIGGSSSRVNMHPHAAMWATQGAASPGWAVQGPTSAGWAVQGPTSAGWAMQGATSGGWAGEAPPSAMSYQQVLPTGAIINPALPDSSPCWRVAPQQGGGVPPVKSLANMGSGAGGQGLADPQQTVHAETCSPKPWESANGSRPLAPSVGNAAENGSAPGASEVSSPMAWERDVEAPLPGGALGSPPPSDLDFLGDFLPQSSAGVMTSHAPARLLTSQAMTKGEPIANGDDDLLPLADYNEGLGELPEPVPWPSPLGYSAAFPAGLVPSGFQSDGRVPTPLSYGQRAGGQSHVPWHMQDGKARAFSLAGRDPSGAVCGNSLKDMWIDEVPQ